MRRWDDVPLPDPQIDPKEFVPNEKRQEVRQAGASLASGEFIKRFKLQAEQSLYVFAVGVMGRSYLTSRCHLPVSDFVQKVPPFRKMVLFPRNHAKTSIVSHCLPPHILIQQAAANVYFPGVEGSECRILLAGEKEERAKDNLRVVSAAFTSNQLLRSLWPERCWDKPRRDAPKWNDAEIVIPRQQEWPDASLKAIGVGGAITGARPNVIIKDDIISVEASNSDAVMKTAINWHIVSRALLEEYETNTGLQSLEFIIGTHWATFDYYTYVKDNDPTVEHITKSIYTMDEEGVPLILWPERYTWDDIQELKHQYGRMFWLLFMNQPFDPSLTDFNLEMVRRFSFKEGRVVFDEDGRDKALSKKADVLSDVEERPTMPLNSDTYDTLFPSSGRKLWYKEKWRSLHGKSST